MLARRAWTSTASVTYADSKIKENDGFVVVPGDTIGKWQPNIPTLARHARWRATGSSEHWTAALGARYSGPQYRTLNNADINGFTYQGVSKYFTVDVRVLYQIDAPVERGLRHRQPEQLQVLELPSVSAAQLQRPS